MLFSIGFLIEMSCCAGGLNSMLFLEEVLIETSCGASRALEVQIKAFFDRLLNRNKAVQRPEL